ncbi:hypothetical protein GN244_ATG15155 [Phytophthora infestans]|uniref:Uncharacterized protein n=1 Tax=Phytophthora infestans TaxID=4787 RepID=A0A833VXL3_PHYIN|nr:hypothetical protein GN244_ATG15155 [Phytophthora infestans]
MCDNALSASARRPQLKESKPVLDQAAELSIDGQRFLRAVTSGSGGHRLKHGEFRYPPPHFSTADQIRVGHAFDKAMQGHDRVAEKLWAGLGLRGTSAPRAYGPRG